MKEIIFFLTIFAVTSEISCCFSPPTKPGGACDVLQQYLVSRKDWSGEEPSEPMECLWGPVTYIIVHHTGTGACNTTQSCVEFVKKLQKQHMSRQVPRWPEIEFDFLIGNDRRIYEIHPTITVNTMGRNSQNHNRNSIGIAFIGNYQKESPSTRMLDLLPKIVYCGVEKGYIHPNFLVIGHRDAYCSTCPGDALYKVIKKWPNFPEKVPIPSYTCDTKKVAPGITEVEPTTTITSPTTTAKILPQLSLNYLNYLN